MRRLVLALGLAAAVALPVPAQERARLVAETVRVEGSSTLVAEGGVEIVFQGRILRASRVAYDRAADRLTIAGPITLNDGTGAVLLADQADLAADLTQGVLTSARLVLDQQLQLAARSILRESGRYTELTDSVASSCRVCAGSMTPLWEIRAARIVHDQQTRQIYFSRAQLRLAGIPVAFVPRLRVPDPTLDRATGFLTPSVRTTSGLGGGLRLPYFIAAGDRRDLTVTPYLTTRGGRTVALRYREALASGRLQIEGAVSRDRLAEGRRGYILGRGVFVLPRDFRLAFRVEGVSDPAYYLDYGLEERDRLDNRLEVTRTRRNEYILARLVYFESIRAGEDNATLPSALGDATLQRRFSGGPLGGEAGLRLQWHSHDRRSVQPLDLDGDGNADGRDLSRLSLRLDWRRDWMLPAGMVGALMAEGTGDLYRIGQDAAFEGRTTRLSGTAAAELRWPWARAGSDGATQIVEPVVQLVVSGRSTAALPNEDSALIEFDEGNLYSLNRFAGSDARERGVRANLGLGWTRIDATGREVGLTFGRVLRRDEAGGFGPSSGLAGRDSDWLAVFRVTDPAGLALTNRLVIGDGLGLTKAEVRLDLDRDRYGLAGSYVQVRADPQESRPRETRELVLDGRYRIAGNWTGRVRGRYDFVADEARTAGVGLGFRTECLSVDLSLSRRFTSSTSVRPTTDFGLQVDLLGFGSGKAAGPARPCR